MWVFKYGILCTLVLLFFLKTPAVGDGSSSAISLEELMRDMGVRPANYTLQNVAPGGSIWTTVVETAPLSVLGVTKIQKGQRVCFIHLDDLHWLVYSPAHNQRIKVKIRRHTNPVSKPRVQVTAVYR